MLSIISAIIQTKDFGETCGLILSKHDETNEFLFIQEDVIESSYRFLAIDLRTNDYISVRDEEIWHASKWDALSEMTRYLQDSLEQEVISVRDQMKVEEEKEQ